MHDIEQPDEQQTWGTTTSARRDESKLTRHSETMAKCGGYPYTCAECAQLHQMCVQRQRAIFVVKVCCGLGHGQGITIAK